MKRDLAAAGVRCAGCHALGWLVPLDWARFEWPAAGGGWRLSVFGWWGLLVASGFLVFLPGVLDRSKFTQVLVGHSHLAMAGFTSSFVILLLIGAGFALVAAVLVPGRVAKEAWQRPLTGGRSLGMVAAVVALTALVWLDSAAFFIIQHAPQLKAGTWGDGMLWRNAGLHLAAGALAGWWLDRGGLRSLLATGFVVLGAAALLVQQDDWRLAGAWLYPVAVSLYSTALVCWPALLGGRGPRSSAWRAAVLFAVAGWFGSANGIGMVTRLERIPTAFVIVAGVDQELRTARVVKFGVPGGEMPGHEVLGDEAVVALARYVMGLSW